MNKPTERELILKEVYKYTGAMQLTELEKAEVLDMFQTPSRFTILRKLLNVFTTDERDFVLPSEEIKIAENGVPTDFKEYGERVYINALAEDKMRKSLASAYANVRAWQVASKEAELDAEEAKKKEEADLKEKGAEEKKEEKRVAGENV